MFSVLTFNYIIILFLIITSYTIKKNLKTNTDGRVMLVIVVIVLRKYDIIKN